MRLYPAIDIKNGQCVRLRQGLFDDTTVYAIKKEIKVGDYVYYEIDTTKYVNLTASLTEYTLFFSSFSTTEAYLLLFFIISLLMWFCGQNPST